jgi:HK97 family phage major capsid protein
MDLEQMRVDLAYLEACLRDIHGRAEGRALTDDESRQWTEGREAVLRLRGDIQEIENRQNFVRDLARRPGHVEDGLDLDPIVEGQGLRWTGRGSSPWDMDAVSRSLYNSAPESGGRDLLARSLAAVEHMRGVKPEHKEHMTTLLESFDLEDDGEEGRGARAAAAHILAASSPEYIRAWSKAFRSGIRTGQPDVSALQVLQRAASLTDAQGGYAVPLPIDPTLIVNYDGNVNPLRALGTVKTVTTNKFKVINVGAVTSSYDAEAAEVSDDTPTWGADEISVHTGRGFIPFSLEISMDYPGFMGDLQMLLRESKDDLEAQKFTLGTGSGEPWGVITAMAASPATYVVPSTTTDTFALADVYKLSEVLPARWSANASWMANKTIYSSIRQAGGANLDDFWAGLREGRPSSLLGFTPYEASYMDGAINATQDNYVLLLGDLRWYWIAERIGMSMELIPHMFGATARRPTGQRGVFAWWRNGADVVNHRAMRLLNVT